MKDTLPVSRDAEHEKVNAAALEALKAELLACRAERDEYRQEVFESERYAAWLTLQRQTLLLKINGGATVISQSGDGMTMLDYVHALEDYAWKTETWRLKQETYVEWLEARLWEQEGERIAQIASR